MRCVVLYRACGVETDANKPFRPNYFSKFKAFKSAWGAFNGRVDFRVIWDGPETRLLEYINTFTFNELVKLNFCNNQKSLEFCYNYYLKICDNFPLVYFLEDDFYHLPNAFDILMEGFCMGFHYITLYDHVDRYNFQNNNDVTLGREWILFGKLSHWRTAESTTCTFATNATVFNESYQDLIKYCLSGQGAPDDRGFFRNMLKKNRRLFSPIPGLATHMVGGLLGPRVYWEEFSDSIII